MLLGLHGENSEDVRTCCKQLELLTPIRRLSFIDRAYYSAGMAVAVEPHMLLQFRDDPGALLTVEGTFPQHHPHAGEKYIYSQITIRNYLQLYAKEAHRDIFGEDFWATLVDLSHTEDELVIVTDIRFANEVDFIHKAGGIVASLESIDGMDDLLVEAEVDWFIDVSHDLDANLWEIVQELRHRTWPDEETHEVQEDS